MRVSRNRILAMGAIAGAMVIWATMAYACTAVSNIDFDVVSGAPGSETNVRGTSFNPGPVELRWGAATGPVVATAMGPEFTAQVKIPEVAPGVSYLVAVQTEPDGRVWKAPASFEVVRPGESGRLTAQPWSDAESGAGRSDGNGSMLLGVGLLSVGVGLLSAGFAVAHMRRRRALATVDGS